MLSSLPKALPRLLVVEVKEVKTMSPETSSVKLSLLTVTAASRVSGIERRLLRKAIEAGEVPCIYIAGCPRVERQSLHNYVASQLQRAQVLTA